MKELPSRLRRSIALHLNGNILRQVPFFQDANPGFINELATYMKGDVFEPGEWIVKYGDVGFHIYFIQSGKVQVLDQHQNVFLFLSIHSSILSIFGIFVFYCFRLWK